MITDPPFPKESNIVQPILSEEEQIKRLQVLSENKSLEMLCDLICKEFYLNSHLHINENDKIDER